MALITRFTRLFRADMHAVLDRVEEPSVLLRQAVREMEEDTVVGDQRRRGLQHELAQVDARRLDLEHSISTIGDELDVCFDSGKEHLARSLIRRRLEAEQLLKVLNRKRQTVADALSELQTRLHENRERLEAMRQKAELLTEEQTAYRIQPWTVPHITIREEDVEVAFLREQQSRRSS